MSGFNSPIIGGQSKLVRNAIMSPDYVLGVSGWTVNKDGSAEFNDATFRGTVVIDSSGQALLVYNGTPAAGNLIASISASNDIDAFGNEIVSGFSAYGTRGITFQRTGAGSFASTSSLLLDPTTGIMTLFSAFGNLALVCNAGSSLILDAPIVVQGQAELQVGLTVVGPTQFGSGISAGYYYEEVKLGGQVVPTGVTTQLTGFSALELLSDYGSKFALATGLWTCPISGVYEFTAYISYTAWVTGSRATIGVTDTTTGATIGYLDAPASSNVGEQTLSFSKFIAANDVLEFTGVQVTGSNKTVNANSYISIGRKL